MSFMADDGYIVHFNDNNIFQANSIDLAFGVVVDDEVLATETLMVSDGANALGIGWKERAVLFPVANIVPTQIGGDNNQIMGLFEDAIVNGDGLQARP